MDRDGVQPDSFQQHTERLRRIQKEVKRLIIPRPHPPGRCPHRKVKRPVRRSDDDKTRWCQSARDLP